MYHQIPSAIFLPRVYVFLSQKYSHSVTISSIREIIVAAILLVTCIALYVCVRLEDWAPVERIANMQISQHDKIDRNIK